jgi:hypothetical protein
VSYDPLVIDAVERVRDRFGPEGLRSLVELAQREIARAERAWAGLADAVERGTPAAVDPGEDTRQFQAFVDEGEPAEDDLDRLR